MNEPTPEIKKLIDDVIKSEGWDKYTNNPNDRGGPTKWGVTEATARAFGYVGDVKDMTYEQAFEIYLERFWLQPKFDRLMMFSKQLALICFSWGVNSGPAAPSKALQRALNVLNRRAKDYPDIDTDGSLGRMSFSALTDFAKKRGSEGMSNLEQLVRAQWSVFYMGLAEKDESQEDFVNGWLSRVGGV